MPAVTVIYHADCLDGFGAAYAAWRRFGDSANYRALHHGDALASLGLAGGTVYILDFSYPPAQLEALAEKGSRVVQIDHHLSAAKDWDDRLTEEADGSYVYRDAGRPLEVRFNMDKSGARLAWEYFHPAQPVPCLLRHVEDLDLWRFALPDTRAFCRALRLRPFDFALWHDLVAETTSAATDRHRQMVAQGAAIEAFCASETMRLAHSRLTAPARLRGEPVDALQARRHGQAVITDGDAAWLCIDALACNANAVFTSELGDILAERSGSAGLVWVLAGDGWIKASLRSRGGIDVSAIAARYGGGGHRNAAGFRMPVGAFLAEVLGRGASVEKG